MLRRPLELGPSPSPDDCRAALKRVTASAVFRTAPRLTAFLRFAVETTLFGQARSIKAYTVAVEALGRPPDFDPNSDPIVRVEAVRLRAALSQYYGGDGRTDPLVIALPRGRYVPQFQWRSVAGGASSGGRVQLAFERAAKRPFADEARWPVEPGALAALVDLGLSTRQIADYFGVEHVEIEALCHRYGVS